MISNNIFTSDIISGYYFHADENIIVDGRIGIGTTSPSAIAQIETNDGSTIYDPSDTKPPSIGDYILSLRNTYEGGNVAGTLAGIQFNIDGDGTGSVNSLGSINLVIEEDNLQKAALCFSPDPGDSNRKEAMRISSDGYIGVGTTDPVAPIHIKRDSQGGEANALVLQNNFANDIGESVNLSFRGTADHDLASIDALVTAADAGGKYPADLIFKTSAAGQDKAEKLRIASDGKVGIGTTSPSRTLHLVDGTNDGSGGIKVQNYKPVIELSDSSTNATATTLTQDDTKFTIANDGVDSLTINSAGNVGIGTTSPAQLLHVNSSPDVNSARIRVQNGEGYAEIATDGTDGFLTAGGSEALRFDSNGHVGIGTTMPESELHIVGKTTIQSSGPVLVLKDSDGGDSNSQVGFIDYRDQNDIQRGYIGFGSHDTKEFTMWNMIGDIRFGTGTTVRMRIKENGTVEIPGDLVVTGTTTTNNVETVSTSNGVVFEGSATDNHEGLLKAGTLTADRTYTLPNASGTVALTNNISNSTVTITAGGALTGGGSFTLNGSGGTITLNHQDTSSQGSSNNSGRTYIQDIGLDAYGHVTSIGTATETVVDTIYSAGNHLTLSNTNQFSVNRDLRGATNPATGVYAIGQNNQSYFMIDGILSQKADTYLGGTHVSRLEEDGDLHIEGDVLAFSTTVSDKKFKNNINQIKSGLEKVKKLRGVEFDWNATSRKGTRDIGVIAQEVEEVVPEVVREKVPCVGEFCENTEKYKTVDYSKLVPVLIEAIKDLSAEVEELKKKLS